MTLDGDTAYVYGTSNPDKPLVFGFAVRVARVPAASIRDRSQWRYWNGSQWSATEDDAREVIGPVGGVSQTFSVFRHGSRWYAASKRDGYLGSDLAMWAAPDPWGPFADPVTVGRIPNSADDRTIVRYMPLAHPELRTTDPDAVLVSVSRNSESLSLLSEFPLLYRPFFVEVPMPPVPSDRLLEGPPPT
jgi:hypothetical protein